jgi:oxygen-dependent protoporphyrinogen oxidase
LKRVVVVGGGIAGLTAAYVLRNDARVTLLERRDRFGGTIATLDRDGFLIEGGPDSMLTAKPAGVELCRELGLGDRIIGTIPENRKVYVLNQGKLEPLPAGMMLTVPTKMSEFLKSRLISWEGKMRMAMERFIPAGAEVEDESLASFVRRRLGQEALDKIAEPLMAGIYVADAERLSLKSTFPRFLEMERRHGSLIKALSKAPPSGDTSPFASLRGGMIELVDALRSKLSNVDLRLSTPVRRMSRDLRIEIDGETLRPDAVLLAVPPPEAASILREALPELSAIVSSIPVASTATVSLGFRTDRPLDGTGFVIPRAEKRRILACTWSSKKFEGRAPAGCLLVRCFVTEPYLGGDLARLAREELRGIMGLEEEPAVTEVFSWPGANPIYEVGHERKVREIESLVAAVPGLALLGSGFRGIGIPDCIRDAREVAVRTFKSA